MRLLHIPTATEWEWHSPNPFDMNSTDLIVLRLSSFVANPWETEFEHPVFHKFEQYLPDTYGLAWDYSHTFTVIPEDSE